MSSEVDPTLNETPVIQTAVVWRGKELWHYREMNGKMTYVAVNRPARQALKKQKGFKHLPLPILEPMVNEK